MMSFSSPSHIPDLSQNPLYTMSWHIGFTIKLGNNKTWKLPLYPLIEALSNYGLCIWGNSMPLKKNEMVLLYIRNIESI